MFSFIGCGLKLKKKMTKREAAEMIKKHWRTKMAFTRALMKFADHPSAKFTATYGSVKRQTTGEGNVSNIHAMLYKALLKSKDNDLHNRPTE